ncbi:MAG: hypothetical protein ABGW87_01790 [Sphingomonadaceae bacterium]
MIIGTLSVVVAGKVAVSHFVLGLPIDDLKSGEPATTFQLIVTTITLGGGGAFFAALGLMVFRWKTG